MTRSGPWPGLLLPLVAALLLPFAAPAAVAVELRGQTYFLTPPWKVVFRSYYTTVFERGAEYYFTLELSSQAGAGLGALEIQQTSGVDWRFDFDVTRSRAFLGEPRREGAAVPVQVRFDADSRRFRIDFPQPPAPGQTVTVALRPFQNPSAAGVYLFAVTAFPAGPEPVAYPVGTARMSIYPAFEW